MTSLACWCGNEALCAFDRDYRECACGSLVRVNRPAGDPTIVRDEDHDLYGRNYWFEHQRELGLPDLDARADTDLHDRCVHWLRILLSYARPPARVLEIGAGHGAFVKLLDECGFNALGVELSPWVADYARRRHGVQVLSGTVSSLDLPAGGFDVIAAFDVLEHVADPLAAVCEWRRLLSDRGLLIIQTPRRPAGSRAADVATTAFSRMLIPEHLHLFTESSARELLRRAGLADIVVETAVFETDMILVAGPRQLRRCDSAEGPEGLPALLHTLLSVHSTASARRRELEEQLSSVHDRFREAERDRAARLELLQQREEALKHADETRRALEREIQKLSTSLADADRDRIERLARLERIEREYALADRDRSERQAQIEQLEREYLRADRDRIERLQLLEQSDRDLQLQRAELERLSAELSRAEHDAREQREVARLTLERTVEQQHVVVSGLETALAQREQALREIQASEERHTRRLASLETEKRVLEERFEKLRAIAADHQNSRVYKALVRAGRWRGFDARLTPLVRDVDAPRFPLERQVVERTWSVPTLSQPTTAGAIAVDLTPILAGGENGGAKLVSLALVRALARLAPHRQWLLLTSSHSHYEVADLEGANVRRHRLDASPFALTELIAEHPLAALFSPMTASVFDDPRVPVVALVNDAQVWACPEFFEESDREQRRRTLEHVISVADRIVTPSAFTRDVLLAHSRLQSHRVEIIPHSFASRRLPERCQGDIAEILERFELERERYFVYPANFWPHKNHLMLLVAFGQLRARRPDLDLRLVLTGSSRPAPQPVLDAAARMGLRDSVVVTGFLPEADLAALLTGALGLIFPSLYEGFGLPILEAFAAGCPVACANSTSLPEVAGRAALTFDPRKPGDIADAMERLATDPVLRSRLRHEGAAHVRTLESIDDLARQYLATIESVVGRPRQPHDAVASLFGDGWSNGTVVVSHAGGEADLHLQIENPRDVAVTLSAPGVEPVTIPPETGLSLRCSLPAGAGHLMVSVSPTFRPADHGGSTDRRQLGVRVWSGRIHRPGTVAVELLREVVHV